MDTLRFDTVFTELGSATRSFKVYNKHSLSIRISDIFLENGDMSSFRLNVDGLPGDQFTDVEIPPNDSIYVFAEVTINPDQPVSASPFIISELLTFVTNENVQSVRLEAFGQNANYIPNRFFQNGVAILSCDLDEIVWDDPKPYVIYGTLLIDSCTLRLPEGTKIYVHGGVANNDLGIYNDGVIFTLPNGRILAQGSQEKPVIIQDDRLEEDYIGLWGGIRLGPGSKGHSFTHTWIRNGVVGIVADSASTLELNSVTIESTSGIGLFGRHATINARNSLFFDNGGAGCAFTYGGKYTLDYCSIGSFGNDAEALVLTNFFCTDPLCLEGARVNLMECTIRNSIMVGSSLDEITLVDAAEGEGLFNYSLQNCIVRVDELLEPDTHPDFFSFCDPCLSWDFGNALYADIDRGDYHLDTLSIAEQQALPISQISIDKEGNQRDPVTPDIGCFEYVY